MIAISGKKWVERKVSKNLVEKIQQDLKLNEISSKLIVSRKFDESEINNINNKPIIINVFKNNYDFDNATNILINSIDKRENICVLGDYDVDGTAATSLLIRFFKHIKQPHFYYIPDRLKDGYGASKKLFQKLIHKKPKLVIMVDCGSTSNEAVDFLNKNNVKSIIIDHHEINKPYPKSSIIINPKKNDGYEEYNYLCATSLTYFFLDILVKKIKTSFKISNYLIYVLLATICDVMPLRKINKIIAYNAIKDFKIKHNVAFKSLFELIGIKKKISADDLGYLIGPIINAGGRLGHSSSGTELLSSDNQTIVKKKSDELFKLNIKRKDIENRILNLMDFNRIKKSNKNVIIYYDENINEGLIGIIAARLKDYFDKPSIVITRSNNILKGSARSTINYNIGRLIKSLFDNKIIESGGGHNMAAGFTIKKNKIKVLEKFIEIDYIKRLSNVDLFSYYDAEISSSAINSSFINNINKLGPFGNSNQSPFFFIKNLKIIRTNVSNDKHIRAILKPQIGKSVNSICFNCIFTDIGNYLLSYKKNINVIGQIHENIWNNKKTVQLNIKDILI